MTFVTSEIHRICNKYYVPVLTEIHGVSLIAGGAACIGIGGALKVDKYFNGPREPLSFVHFNSHSYTDIGEESILLGVKEIMPTSLILLMPGALPFKIGLVAIRTFLNFGVI